MQKRIRTQFDPAIEAMGWDKIRSRVEVVLRDGRRLERWADERYRGGPDNPLTDAQLQDKFLNCAEGLIDAATSQAVFDMIWALEREPDVAALWPRLDWMGSAARKSA
jgi:2-methylcitrate dehydratase PrpD